MERRAQPWALGIGIAGAALMLAAAAVATRKRSPRAGRTARPPQPASRPGDEVAPGTPQSGEGLCPACSGSGVLGGRRCEICVGTGTVVVNIGDA